MTKELSLAAYTIPTSEVREGFPETHEPYERIIAMGEPGDASLNLLTSPDISQQVITLPEEQAYNLANYYQRFYTGSNAQRATSNCARFACAVSGVEADWGEAFVHLDEVIKPQNIWDEKFILPVGAVGVMGTLAYPIDTEARAFPSRVTHACIGTGTPSVLQVTALGGHVGLRSVDEMLAYGRREITHDGFLPSELLLFAASANLLPKQKKKELVLQ